MSSSVHINNNKKDILIFGIGLTQGLDDTTFTAEALYSINFQRSNRKFCLSLHCNGSNRFSYHSKAKDSKMKKCPLCLVNSSENFSANNMKQKHG